MPLKEYYHLTFPTLNAKFADPEMDHSKFDEVASNLMAAACEDGYSHLADWELAGAADDYLLGGI